MGFLKNVRKALFGCQHHVDVAPGPSEELKETATQLRNGLQPYLDKPDPLAALVSDLWNKREIRHERLRRLSRGDH